MVRWCHNVPGREWERLARRMGRTAVTARISSPSASAAKMPNTRRRTSPLHRAGSCRGRPDRRGHRRGRGDVDLVDAGRLQDIALEVQPLLAVSLRDDAGAGQDAAARVRVCRSAASGACPSVLPLIHAVPGREVGLHAQSSHPPPERVGLHPLRTPAAAGGADAVPGRTWNCGPASIPWP